MTPVAGVPATGIAIRTCVVILEGRDVCLIHRRRPSGDQYTLPGGLVHADEEVPQALARELEEELHLMPSALATRPELRWVQDQITTRPGSVEPFRRLHLIHVTRVSADTRRSLPATEQDADDHARIAWVNLDEAAELHLYPAIGPALCALKDDDTATPVLLPAITDVTYSWR